VAYELYPLSGGGVGAVTSAFCARRWMARRLRSIAPLPAVVPRDANLSSWRFNCRFSLISCATTVFICWT